MKILVYNLLDIDDNVDIIFHHLLCIIEKIQLKVLAFFVLKIWLHVKVVDNL